MLLSSGERISCALCAMAIHDFGHHAISLTGSQAGIVTDESHTKARILDVRADRIQAALEEDNIVLVAGFQGVSATPATSPRSAAGGRTPAPSRVAAALGADVCEIYTDVSGVYCADPRIVPDARRLPVSCPSRRCSRWPPRARGSCSCARSSTPATTACGSTAARRSRSARYLCGRRRRSRWSNPSITAVTHSTSEARVTLDRRAREPGAAARIFGGARRGERERGHDRPERAGVRGGARPRSPSPSPVRTYVPRARRWSRSAERPSRR